MPAHSFIFNVFPGALSTGRFEGPFLWPPVISPVVLPGPLIFFFPSPAAFGRILWKLGEQCSQHFIFVLPLLYPVRRTPALLFSFLPEYLFPGSWSGCVLFGGFLDSCIKDVPSPSLPFSSPPRDLASLPPPNLIILLVVVSRLMLGGGDHT